MEFTGDAVGMGLYRGCSHVLLRFEAGIAYTTTALALMGDGFLYFVH
jgi:hypothetical protein